MKIISDSPDQYIGQLADDRNAAMTKLRQTILDNLPVDFEETMNYGMIGYVVPKSIYPAGYHCDPKLPLPFINIASQKNFVAIYHLGLYADKPLMDWFTSEYPKHTKAKLDMGKSCIRFKKAEQIPFDLIGQLAGKLTVEKWIEMYESNFRK
jgi:hypothetical protein